MQDIQPPMRTAIWSLAAVAAIACFFAFAFQFEKWRVMRLATAQLDVQVDSMDNLFHQYAVTPQLLAGDPRLVELLARGGGIEDKKNSLANEILKNAAEAGNLAEVFLMNAEGLTIAASNSLTEVSFVGKNYSFRPYFQGAIKGNQTTFFGVGATTGIPGYFIANPLYFESRIVGVIVAKVGPTQIPTLWREKPEAVVLTDEFGVVLLASPTELLYVPTKAMTTGSREIIKNERRYVLDTTQRFQQETMYKWSLYIDERLERKYIAVSESLGSEPWQLTSMLPVSHILWRALQYFLAVLALGLIAALLLSRQRQQKQLMLINNRYAKDLEQVVKEKTVELEETRDALISQSNFAMLGRMSAAINHEINQPLASLRFNLASLRQTIEEKSASDHVIRDIVIDSDRTTKRIGRVVETLRSVARYDKLPSSVIDLQRVLQEVLETVQRERPQISQNLSVINEARLTQVYGNSVLLQQAVLNLLYNAFDAVLNLQHPSVVLRLSSDSGVVIIDVTDNGGGVSEDMIDRLFQPFESSLQKTSGMGLGLTLARQIINDHGGSIVYEPATDSAGTNCIGSVFIVTLPGYDSANGNRLIENA